MTYELKYSSNTSHRQEFINGEALSAATGVSAAGVSKHESRPRVAVLDGDEGTRIRLRDMIQSAKPFAFAGSFSNVSEALAEMPKVQPDLALVDIALPGLNGIECIRQLRHAVPCLRTVVMSAKPNANWSGASARAGAVAVLVKPLARHQLVATLHYAACEKSRTTRQSGEFQGPIGLNDHNGSRLPLSPREREVLSHFANGLLYKEISDKLGISFAAVHKYAHNLYRKLHVCNRSEAIRTWFCDATLRSYDSI